MPSRLSTSLESFDGNFGNIKEDIASRLAATKSLFEQLDTSKWSPHDIRAYESLVDERIQLEIDHHKLATNDIALHGGKRKATTADLTEKESNFKYDAVYATYRYYGDNACLLECVRSCSHDLCRRAVSEGLPYLEYDTIIHYDMRITIAKTMRMKDALRKQRDVQLSKDAKAVAAWKEKCINKMGSFGQEAQEEIVKTATQITGWKFSSANIKIEPDTPAEQVGRALSHIRASTLSAEETLFGNTCLDRLRSSKTNQCHWKLPSPYMEYLSSIQIDHLEAAIATIQRILGMNAMLYYECYSCLKGFLEDFRQLVQWTELPHRKPALGATVGLALDDAKVALTLDEMRVSLNPPPRETMPRDPPQSPLCKALKECTDVENRAQLEMWRVQTQHAERGSDPQTGLAEIKRKGIDSSPMPSVSKIALSRLEAMNKEYCIVNTLLSKAKSGISTESLVDAASDHLRRTIGDDWTRFIPTCRSLRAALQTRPIDNEPSSADELAHEQLEKAFGELEKLGDSFNVEIDEKFGQEFKEKRAAVESLAKTVLAGIFENSTEYYLLPGMSRGDDTQTILTEYARTIVIKPKDFEPMRSSWRDLIVENVSRGIGEAFRVYQHFCKHNMCSADHVVLKKLTDESNETADLLCKGSGGMRTFFHQQYQKGTCLASAFLRLLATLPSVSLLNPSSVVSILDTLNIVSKNSQIGVPHESQKNFAELCHIFLQAHGYITIESMHIFGRADVEQIVLSLIFILAFSILTANNSGQAKSNLNFVLSFTDIIFGQPATNQSTSCFKQIKILFEYLAGASHIKCCDPASCVKYKCFPPVSVDSAHPRRSSQLEQGKIPVPQDLDITVYSTKSNGKQQSKQNLERHKAVLSDLIDKELKQCLPLEKGKLLKYCAYQIKMLNKITKESQRFKGLGKLDAEFVDLLWRAFMHTEQVLRVTEPSSLNIGMHNLCNIWELVESKQKTCGLMEGYRRGYRNDKDLRLLAYSCAQYALLNGKREAVPAFHRKREKLRQLAGELPEQLELFLIDEGDALEESTLDNATTLRQTYLRLEYMYQSDPGFFRLDTRYFAEMLDLDVNQFMVFTNTLRVEIELNEGQKSVEVLDNAVDVLVDQTKSAKHISYDDTNLKLVQAAACRAWQRSPHEEFIFSEDEEEDDEDFGYDFVSRCCGTQKSGHTTKLEKDIGKGCNGDKLHFEDIVTPLSKGKKPELQTAAKSVESQSAVYENELRNTADVSTAAQISNPSLHGPNLEAPILRNSKTVTPVLSVSPKSEYCSTEAENGTDGKSTAPKTPELEISARPSKLEEISPSSSHAYAVQTNVADTKSHNSPFYNKLLALKASLATTKAVMDPSSKTSAAAADFSDLVPFQQLQQKTALAELQCEYMLKTLMHHEHSETGNKQDEEDDTRKLLEEIEIVSQRVADSMSKSK